MREASGRTRTATAGASCRRERVKKRKRGRRRLKTKTRSPNLKTPPPPPRQQQPAPPPEPSNVTRAANGTMPRMRRSIWRRRPETVIESDSERRVPLLLALNKTDAAAGEGTPKRAAAVPAADVRARLSTSRRDECGRARVWTRWKPRSPRLSARGRLRPRARSGRRTSGRRRRCGSRRRRWRDRGARAEDGLPARAR